MTTKDPFYKVGYNILCLRKSYNETASDLADAVGVGKSTISEYETGSRGKVPPRNVLMNIAKHYGVTVDDLVEGDYSGFDMGDYDRVTFQALKKLKKILLPIVSSNRALRNANFKKAYERHKKMYEGLENNIDFAEADLEHCLRWYEKASEEGIPEASANILWWFIFVGQLIVEEHLLDGYQAFYDGTSSFNYLMKNDALPNFGHTNPHQMSARQIKEIRNYAADIDDDFFNHAKRLKMSEYADLGDYYIALRYMSILVHNNRSLEANRAMGSELMKDLSLLRNKYALSLMSSVIELTKG